MNYEMYQEAMRIFGIPGTLQLFRYNSTDNQMTMRQLRDLLYDQIPADELR